VLLPPPSPDYSCLSEAISVKAIVSSTKHAGGLLDPGGAEVVTASPVDGAFVDLSK
jgi:hypothetical protein